MRRREKDIEKITDKGERGFTLAFKIVPGMPGAHCRLFFKWHILEREILPFSLDKAGKKC